MAGQPRTAYRTVNRIVTVGEAALGEGVDVVATVAAEHELPVLPPNVRLAPFIPHSALIERIALVACHSGYGTVTRAACAGVPLLLFPAGRDQFQVAGGAAEAGVAIVLHPGAREVSTTREAMRALLADSPYRSRAVEVARAATAYRAAESAADHVEALLWARSQELADIWTGDNTAARSDGMEKARRSRGRCART